MSGGVLWIPNNPLLDDDSEEAAGPVGAQVAGVAGSLNYLLTREAMREYAEAMTPGGVLLVHISNRYLDLEPVVAALAEDAGLDARIASGPQDENDARYENSSTWVAVARTPADLGVFSRAIIAALEPK